MIFFKGGRKLKGKIKTLYSSGKRAVAILLLFVMLFSTVEPFIAMAAENFDGTENGEEIEEIGGGDILPEDGEAPKEIEGEIAEAGEIPEELEGEIAEEEQEVYDEREGETFDSYEVKLPRESEEPLGVNLEILPQMLPMSGASLLSEGSFAEDDFMIDGDTILGLSSSGLSKLAINKELVIDIPGITKIADSAFFKVEMESLRLNGIVEIGDHAFQSTGLEEVRFISDVKKVGSYTFAANQINLFEGDVVESIGDYAFRDNNLMSLNLSSKEIGDKTFEGNNLVDISFSNLQHLGDGALETNRNLTTIRLSSSVPSDLINGADLDGVSSKRIDVFHEGDSYLSTDKTLYLVNPVELKLRPVDEDTGENIGELLDSGIVVEEADKPYTVESPSIDGYEAVMPSVSSNDNPLIVAYRMVEGDFVIILGPGVISEATLDELVTEEELLKNVMVITPAGDLIEEGINVTALDTSSLGESQVIYSFTSPESGKLTSLEHTILIVEPFDMNEEIRDGWYYDDFLYDGNTLLGFSAKGKEKFEGGNTNLVIPDINLKTTETIRNIKENAFASYVFEGEFNAPNIEEVGENAFLVSEFTGDMYAPTLKFVGEGAFQSSMFTGEFNAPSIEAVGSGAFIASEFSGEFNVPQLKLVGDSAFKISEFTGNLYAPSLEEIGFNAFLNSKFTGSFDLPLVKNIGASAFRYSEFTGDFNAAILEVIGALAFEESVFTGVFNAPTIVKVEEEAFYNSEFTGDLHAPYLLEIGDSAFRESEFDGVFDAPAIVKIGEYGLRSSNFTGDFYAPSLVELSDYALRNSRFDGTFYAPSIVTVGEYGLQNSRFTGILDTPLLERVGRAGFENSVFFGEFIAPSLVEVDRDGFRYSIFTGDFNAPILEIIGRESFRYSPFTGDFNAPKVVTIGQDAFYFGEFTGDFNAPSVKSIINSAFYYSEFKGKFNAPLAEVIERYTFINSSFNDDLGDLDHLVTLEANAFNNSNITLKGIELKIEEGTVDFTKEPNIGLVGKNISEALFYNYITGEPVTTFIFATAADFKSTLGLERASEKITVYIKNNDVDGDGKPDAVSTDRIFINHPAQMTIRYLNTLGEEIRDENVFTDLVVGKLYDVEPPFITGYVRPESQKVIISSGLNVEDDSILVELIYESSQVQGGASNYSLNVKTFTLSGTNDNTQIRTSVTISLSDGSIAQPNPVAYIDLPKHVNPESVIFSTADLGPNVESVYHNFTNNQIEIRLKNMSGGNSISFEFLFNTDKNTPNDYEDSVKLIILEESGNQATAEGEKFKLTTSEPMVSKYTNYSSYGGNFKIGSTVDGVAYLEEGFLEISYYLNIWLGCQK